jgi:hypothetical protein
LKKYYASEGLEDDLLIDLPLGHYVPVFSARPPAGTVEPVDPELKDPE